MRRIMGRPWLLGMSAAAFVVLAVVASAYARGGNDLPQATPIVESLEDFPYDQLLASRPSASPSPSPSASPAARSESRPSAPRSVPQAAAAPAAPSGPVTCPSGTVGGEITDVNASQTGDTRRGITEWSVRVTGTVVNRTSRAVRDIRVVVTLRTENAESDSDSVVLGKWVGVGSSSVWALTFDYPSEDKPDDSDAGLSVTSWSWGDEFSQCPKHGSSG